MRLRDPLKVVEDYGLVKQSWGEPAHDDTSLEYYFEPEVASNALVLANNHGAICAGQYIEFVTSELFCPDGSWIGIELDRDTLESRKAATALLEYLGGKLAETNFYNEITKLVKEGVIYNKGLIDCFYNDGLQFNTFKNTDIVCSMGTDESMSRVYTTSYKTKLELLDAFEGPGLEQYMTGDALNDSTMRIKVVTAILPVNEAFFDMDSLNTKYKYIKVYLLPDEPAHAIVIKKKSGEIEGYTSFPLMKYLPHYKNSLAALALSPAIRLNEYEQLIGENARKVNRPAVGIPMSLLTHNNWNIGENGIVPLETNDRQPTPIESTQKSPLSAQEIQRLEFKIDRIFKMDLINRIHLTNVSQYEAARNYMNALKAIQPAAADLVTRMPITLLERINALLLDNDKQYRRLARAAKGKLTMRGLTAKMKKFQKASAIGYIAQGTAPYVQMDPSASMKVNTEKAIEVLADSWNCLEVVNTDEAVRIEQQQMAQQQQAAQQQEARMAEADVAHKQAQAQAATNKQ